MNNEAPIDYIALRQQHSTLKAAFHSLLFPCPHCGHAISESGTKRYNGDLHLECACGAEVSGYNRDFIEILSIWNRRDGKDFDMSSEYAQRLAHLAGEFERFKKNAVSELRTYLKQIEELKTEKAGLELRAARSAETLTQLSVVAARADELMHVFVDRQPWEQFEVAMEALRLALLDAGYGRDESKHSRGQA